MRRRSSCYRNRNHNKTALDACILLLMSVLCSVCCHHVVSGFTILNRLRRATATAPVVSSTTSSSSSSSSSTSFSSRRPRKRIQRLNVGLELYDHNPLHSILLDTTSALSLTALSSSSSPPELGGIGYSKVSYYTVLSLYLLSFPGLWSTIQRSTTAKLKNKTFVAPGVNAPVVHWNANCSSTAAAAANEEDAEAEADATEDTNNHPSKKGKGGGLGLREQAAEIMAYMKANNYQVADATNEVITFRGRVPRSLSQAFFLTFCTALALLSLALVLQIQFHQDNNTPGGGGGINWFYLAFLSPYAGLYYWKRSDDRIDTCQVKLSTNADETENEMIVLGSEEEVDRMWRTLQWQEKGMVKVEGLLDKITTTTTTSPTHTTSA